MATSESQKPSSYKPKGKYDIFLSFRGLDTRQKFTDHLYHALRHEGFQIFRDDDEIERGEDIKSELLESIRSSRMSVIVLSETYAKSTACLFELQNILELYKKSDHFVLPVFYEVEPSEVKKQSKNLVFENKEVGEEKVKGWSAALKVVASMAGMVFRKGSDSHEAKFIEEIVRLLKGKLACRHRSVSNHLVDMDSRIQYVNCWLKDRSSRVGFLLICGMGGIGKTTIAKIVYNSNHRNYDAACFVENVREVSKGHNGLVNLQRCLLSDILGKNERINNVDDGHWRIRYALSNRRVLLVLDDVDQKDQLFALAGQKDWFIPGSKIIITTRVGSMMNADESFEVYRPKQLSNYYSLELFSWHAFGQKHPIQGRLMDLSKFFVQHCNGLPLALEVLGSSLRWEAIDVWESTLKKLEATSDNTILEKLEISFDSLKDNHDKNLFLDIACFFVGRKKNETISILEGCDYSALAGIHNLVDRNLLTIVNEKLQMHQLLQDMGKQIVCRESNYIEKRSRIWRPKESFNILLDKIGTKYIIGLVLDMSFLRNSNMVVFEANTFKKMYNLRLLKMTGVKLSGTYEAFPKRLQWLYWHDFPSQSFPNDFPLENLVSLDMSYSNLEQVWSGTEVLGSLKFLNLSHSPKLAKTPDFSRIPNLEKLVLKACPSLFEVDDSFVKLQRIESLNLRDCKNLRKLPRNINTVESLVEINISGCSNLIWAIVELEKMKSLQDSGMDITCVPTMEVGSHAFWVPKPMVQMSSAYLPCSLVQLYVFDCNLTDDGFPRALSNLSKLQHLSLSRNPISSLPNFVKDLTGLQTLDLSYCQKLQQIRWSSTILDNLEVMCCDALEEITFETGADIKKINSGFSKNLYHVQNNFKFLSIREVDVDLLNSIGFFNLDSVADVEATIVIGFSTMALMLPIQVNYTDNVFSTFFPGKEVPHWFSNKHGGSTISFTATLSPHFGFRGLNLCLVYTLPDETEFNFFRRPYHPFYFEINSKSSGMKTVYKPCFYGIPKKGEHMVWLSHCSPANLFTEGDEVEVSFEMTHIGGQIKECGVHLLYFEEEGEVSQFVSIIKHSWDSVARFLLATETSQSKALINNPLVPTWENEAAFAVKNIKGVADFVEDAPPCTDESAVTPSTEASSERVPETLISPDSMNPDASKDSFLVSRVKSDAALSKAKLDRDLLFQKIKVNMGNRIKKSSTSASSETTTTVRAPSQEEVAQAKAALKLASTLSADEAFASGQLTTLKSSLDILTQPGILEQTLLEKIMPFKEKLHSLAEEHQTHLNALKTVNGKKEKLSHLERTAAECLDSFEDIKQEEECLSEKRKFTAEKIFHLQAQIAKLQGQISQLENDIKEIEVDLAKAEAAKDEVATKAAPVYEEYESLKGEEEDLDIQAEDLAVKISLGTSAWDSFKAEISGIM